MKNNFLYKSNLPKNYMLIHFKLEAECCIYCGPEYWFGLKLASIYIFLLSQELDFLD